MMQRIKKSGFTLIELLVVLAIIVALFAILAPNILSYRHKSNVRQADSQIKNFERFLEVYAADHGRYPTTEEGLKALIYIPSTEATGMAMNMMQQGMNQQMGQDGMLAGGQGNSMAGGASSVGGVNMQAGMGQQGMGMGMDQQGMGMSQQGMGMGMDQSGMGMGQQQGMGMGMDQQGMGMGQQQGVGMGQQGMGTDQSGGMAGGSTLGVGMSNPNLYVNARKRSDPYVKDDKVLLDPWKQPYRYDNTVTASGVNRFTGERNPAIWSAGYDGVDGTEDDIRNWDPQVAAQQLMNAQQGQGMGQGMGMGMDQQGMGMGQQQGMGMGMDQQGMGMGQQQGMGMGQQGQGMGQQGMPQMPPQGMGQQGQGMGQQGMPQMPPQPQM